MLFLLAPLLSLATPAFAQAQPEPSADVWRATLERAAPAVVSIKVVGTRSFDTESAGSSVGTGFVVDAERGIILTNRHMVHAGPVVAEAVFLNNEEVPLQAIYRDPVHDFGFYRFDPADVKYQDFEPLSLNPDGARIGESIRVVGNDAGDKLSFLDGTISRLDRPAPNYGGNTYNDFNTFYIQAASGTSGGSSGSPVIDQRGQVVALNAGGRSSAASSYYLPLYRVVRALELVQQGEPVARGTLQTVLRHMPYDELRRLGLQPDTESAVRETFPEGTGMLVVTETVPDGPAHDKLQPGDVVVRLDGELLDGFLPLEATLDDSVGGAVTLGVQRGGEAIELELQVGDLHAITPAEYLELGGGAFHALSYQQARNHVVPAQGVYVATQGYMLREAGVPDSAIITAVDGVEVPTLDDFQAAFAERMHGERVPVRYFSIGDPRQDQVAVVTMDRLWFPTQRCVRDDSTGGWPCTVVAEPSSERASVEPGNTLITAEGPRVVRRLSESLVKVEYDIPYRTEGVNGAHYAGAGVIVDAERGLVVCDRDTVPVGLGELQLVFGGALRVPGEVVFVHPIHNITVLRYDPALIGDTPVRSATLRSAELSPGDPMWLVGLSSSHQTVSRKTTVGRIDPMSLGMPDRPHFRDINMEGINTNEGISSVGGVLADRRGRVVATWASFVSNGGGRDSFFRGLPIELVQRVIEPLQEGREVGLRTLGLELFPISLSDARDRGLSDERVRELTAHDPRRRQALYVVRTTAGSPAHDLLKGGDLLLAVNGEPVTRFIEVERAEDAEVLGLTVFRDGEELELQVPTLALSGKGIDRALAWSGLLLHAPHHEVSAQKGLAPEGVYVTWFWYGSPAHRYGFRPTRRIVEVDGMPTPDLDAFLAAVADKENGEAVRVKMLDLDDRPQVRTLKVDLEYWPTREFVQTEDGWQLK